MEELSLNEISEILDLPLGTVKTRIHRGREALRQQLRYV
jgi:RNA polymerase sigma-70 factor (ECF subfamily)